MGVNLSKTRKKELPNSGNDESQSSSKSTKVKKNRLEDVFQDDIANAFVKMTDFKTFARSSRGLCLDEPVIQRCVEDNVHSFDQKMAMLNKWKDINGEEATADTIYSLVSGFQKGGRQEDYISVCKGMYGIYKNQLLSKESHVYLGEQLSGVVGRRFCAIKFALYEDEILREVGNLTRLGSHENIVSTIYTDIYHSVPFSYILIIMELCWRKNLRAVFEEIKRKPMKNVPMAIDWAIQITRALVFIHEHNILHRDLKPDNILISDNFKYLKLTDFGISKEITDGVQTIRQTRTNENTGTDGYRAKETYDKNAKISKKSDVYAGGITMTEIFSNGTHPYGDDPHLRSSKIIKEKEPDLSHVFVKQAHNLLCWMLKSDADGRPSAKEVLKDLNQLEQDIINPTDQQPTSSGMNPASTRYMIAPWMLEQQWEVALREEFQKPYFKRLNEFVTFERERHQISPPYNEVFAWTHYCDIEDVKVVIVGDQPYSTPGRAHGLSFSVERDISLPLSLQITYLKN